MTSTVQHTQLGRTGLVVSRLALGTQNFGPYTSEETSFEIMDCAFDHGIQLFDTANEYGRHFGRGASEEIVGRWCAARPGRRAQLVLGTKVYGTMGDGPNDRGLSARHIKLACDESLRRLQTDYIDLYQMHHVDRRVPWEEIWQAMEHLISAGKVLYVGSSNFAAWHLMKANEMAHRKQLFGIVSEQSVYHLNNRMVELEVLPMCRAEGLGFLAWGPLGGGLLAGALEDRADGRRGTQFIRTAVGNHRARLQMYETLCDDLGTSPAELALAWVMSNPAVTAPIIGPRTPAQLESAIRASHLGLPADTLDKLDAVFPGPGGHAPEAYAW